MAFLPNFEKRLVLVVNLDLIGLSEILDHVAARLVISMIKDVVFGVHVPLDLVNFVSTMWTILSHDNGAFEFSVNVALIMASKSIFDQCFAVFDREKFRNVVDNEVEATLEDPG